MKLTTLIITSSMLCASSHGTTILNVNDSISVFGAAVATTDGGSDIVVKTTPSGDIDNSAIYSTAAENPGIGTNGPLTYQFGIRERLNATQATRRWVSFFNFDVSSIPSADLADPTFTATFTIDYAGQLNNLNGGFDVNIAQVNTAWDTTTNLPSVALSDASTSLGNLVTNVAGNPNPIPGLTVDITSLVQGWADGSIPNNGLTFDGNFVPQGAYFNNPTITAAVIPEPSSLALLGLAGGLLLRRRRSW